MSFEEYLQQAKNSGLPFRIEHDCKTKESSVIYMTDSEIQQAQETSILEHQIISAQEQLNQVNVDLHDYLLNFVASKPDAPQSVKDFVAGRDARKTKDKSAR